MIENNEISTSINGQIDQLEAVMQNYAPVDCPLRHQFTPGMYSRTIFMPKDTLITSLIHKTEHQFVVSGGSAFVKINEKEWQRIEAPFVGVTKPGTRRVLVIESDCTFTTFHPTDIQPADNSQESILEAVKKVESVIIEPHVNEHLGGQIKNNVLTKTIKNED
jgi:hypothetical protein